MLIILIKNQNIKYIEQQPVLILRNNDIPLVKLSDVFGIPIGKQNNDGHIIIVDKGINQIGLVIDKAIGEQEIMVKALSHFAASKMFSGGTTLADGRVVLIIDTNNIE